MVHYSQNEHKIIYTYLAVLLISLPIGLFYALHLVAFPIIFTILAWVLCFIEDEIKEYFNRRELTEEERSQLRDL